MSSINAIVKILIQNPVHMTVDYYKSIGILHQLMNMGGKYLQEEVYLSKSI
jgi:hypothetical protein